MSVLKAKLVLKIKISMEDENRIMFTASLFPSHILDLPASFSSKFAELLKQIDLSYFITSYQFSTSHLSKSYLIYIIATFLEFSLSTFGDSQTRSSTFLLWAKESKLFLAKNIIRHEKSTMIWNQSDSLCEFQHCCFTIFKI